MKKKRAVAMPVKKREIFGWAMFDFANSSYTTVVITVIYSAFFVGHIVPKEKEGEASWFASMLAKIGEFFYSVVGETVVIDPQQFASRDSYWSIAMIISTIIAIFLSPLLGLLSDYTGFRKRYLFGITLFCSVLTSALWFVSQGDILLGITLVALSNAAFMLSESFCGSFLTDLATKDNMAWISGLGWGIGYMGGLASLIMVMLVITADVKNDLTTYIEQNQLAMLGIGLFFLVSSLPTFILMRDRSLPTSDAKGTTLVLFVKAGATSMRSSFALLKQYPVLYQFLIAFTVYMAGMDAVIKFIGIYATDELHFKIAELTTMFLLIQFSAMAGALGFGFLEKRWGPKRTVLMTLVLWVSCILGVFFLENIANGLSSLISSIQGEKYVFDGKLVFWAMSILAGTAMGSVQSSSRAVVGLLSPKKHAGQMFGIWGMFARFATILGMGYGFSADIFSRRYALLLIVFFFVAGGLLLTRTPLKKGIQYAAKKNRGL